MELHSPLKSVASPCWSLQKSPLTDERIVRAYRTFKLMFYCEFEIELKNPLSDAGNHYRSVKFNTVIQ